MLATSNNNIKLVALPESVFGFLLYLKSTPIISLKNIKRKVSVMETRVRLLVAKIILVHC
jgi:hypothetical protein